MMGGGQVCNLKFPDQAILPSSRPSPRCSGGPRKIYTPPGFPDCIWIKPLMSDTGVTIAPNSLHTTDTMRPYSVLLLLASTVSGAPYEVTEAAPVPEKLVQGGHQYHEKSVQCRTEYQTIWDTEYQVRKCKCPSVCLYLKVPSLNSLSLSCRAYSNSSESVLCLKSSWSC